MYSPVELEKKTADEIRLDIQRIYEELAPCDIALADIEDTTPDSKVIEFLNIVDDVQGKC